MAHHELVMLMMCARGHHCHACEDDTSKGQVWPTRATARGVLLASTRLGRVWLLRPTARGVSLASIRRDQVCNCGLQVLLAAIERQN